MSAVNELKDLCPFLASDLESAETEIETNPNRSLDKLADWESLLVHVIFTFEGLDEPADGESIDPD